MNPYDAPQTLCKAKTNWWFIVCLLALALLVLIAYENYLLQNQINTIYELDKMNLRQINQKNSIKHLYSIENHPTNQEP